MMSLRRAFVPSALGLVLALSGRPAAACSCAYAPEQDHACVSYPNTDAVFSGRVASVSVVSSQDEAWGPRFRVFRFEILEGFSGVDGAMVDVRTGMGGGDCGVDFEEGKSYFVYARRMKDVLSTSICSRTRPLDRAAADLDHARRVASGAPYVALFGRVEHVERAGVEDRPTRRELKGIEVTVEGPGGERLSALTDEDGRFEIRGRLSGAYTVRAASLEGLPPAASREVVVPAGGCVGTVLQVSVLGRIQGRVVEADGKPASSSIRLSLIPVRETPENAQADQLYIGEDGTFELREVLPGDYLLAVNPHGPSLYGPPYPPTFYPAAGTREGALPITVRPAETLELRDLQLPPRLVERTVSGHVRRYDGQPAAGVLIRVIGPDGEESTSVGTDDEGRFEIQGYEGYRYRIAAERRFRTWATCSARVEVEIASENEPLHLALDRFSTAPAPCLPEP